MLRFRNRSWFRLLSVLVLAVFIQAQAAGCCKIGAWFHAASKPASASGSPAAFSSNSVPAGTMAHSCCPKPSSEDGISTADASGPSVFPGSMERTCCIQDTDLNAAEIVSIHDGSPAYAAPSFQRVLETLSAPRSEAFAASAFLDSGPPASRSALPLLI